jgi:hypothetical protein
MKWKDYKSHLDQGLWNSTLSEYSSLEFVEITKRLLYSRYKLKEEIAAAIADVVWNNTKTSDM